MAFIKLDTGELLNTAMIESIRVSGVEVDPSALRLETPLTSDRLFARCVHPIKVHATASMPSGERVKILLAEIQPGSDAMETLMTYWAKQAYGDDCPVNHMNPAYANVAEVRYARTFQSLVHHPALQEILESWLHSNK